MACAVTEVESMTTFVFAEFRGENSYLLIVCWLFISFGVASCVSIKNDSDNMLPTSLQNPRNHEI